MEDAQRASGKGAFMSPDELISAAVARSRENACRAVTSRVKPTSRKRDLSGPVEPNREGRPGSRLDFAGGAERL